MNDFPGPLRQLSDHSKCRKNAINVCKCYHQGYVAGRSRGITVGLRLGGEKK